MIFNESDGICLIFKQLFLKALEEEIKAMDVVKAYSRRSLFWIIFFMGILCALIDGALYIALDFILIKLSALSQAGTDSTQLQGIIQDSLIMADMVKQFYIPASAGIFLLASLFLWLCSRLSLSGVVKKYEKLTKPEKAPEKKPEIDKKEKQRSEQRMFLHLLSVLQREGRLIDFFSEDIDEYDDEQIGAAVRNIHENCRKFMEKYLSADPVVEEEEEEEIIVEPGFDPNAIKLTGNVTGDPPFKGIVRHRGWKAGKIEIPSLSGAKDPGIIAPAEVEIL